MTYKAFNPVTQKMDENLKLAWLHKMAKRPDQYLRGKFFDQKTGCMCALGQLLDVLGHHPSTHYTTHPQESGETIGRFRLCEYYLGPKYERVYCLSDTSGSYANVIHYVNTEL